MRVLLLKRQSLGGINTHVGDLAAALADRDCEVVVLDASDWIPNETGPRHDREVSKRLYQEAEGFDRVHAFGYRCAWACSACFGDKRPWVYTAYDMPKTKHPLLVARLNEAGAGLGVSRAVTRALDDMLVMRVETVPPGVRRPVGAPDRASARAALGLDENVPVVAGVGRWIAERGFVALVRAMGEAWSSSPEAVLLLAGEGPEDATLHAAAGELAQPSQVRLLGRVDTPYGVMAAADVFVVPSYRGAVSMAAMEAMSLGVSVLIRDVGGLSELVDPDLSGMLFDTDEQLGPTISEMLGLPLTRETIGGAGRVAAEDRFRTDRNAERTVELYESVH